MSAEKPLLQFTPFASVVQPGFWQELTKLKIDVLKLSQEAIPICGSYSIGKVVTDRETGLEVALGCTLTVGGDAFTNMMNIKAPPHSVTVQGILKNFNTIEDFKTVNKQELFNLHASKMWELTQETGDTSHLSRFLLITFADLKKYKYYYWFAFPAFVADPPWERVGSMVSATTVISLKAMEALHKSMHSTKSQSQSIASCLIARPAANDPMMHDTAPLEEYTEFFKAVPEDKRLIIFADPSAHAGHVGWPLRNIISHIQHHHSQAPLHILAFRDTELPGTNKPWKSLYLTASSPAQKKVGQPSSVGWEKNPAGKLGPRMADLAPMMDPKRLADQAVDLNLKLMRWRILPALDLDKVANTKVLLLGAGTLGCYVARTLMGWGVRKITFVDSARVSFSNPVRQPLFEFEDCLGGGKPKAAAAAASLKRIFPGVDAEGHEFQIPMPGHPIPPASIEQTKEAVKKLEGLIDSHDAVFLLMDSRESRWLPTVIGAAKGKIVMNCALGFDSFLVMRHGAREKISPAGSKRLGCYFCNDIVAPADSLKDQTLDQMCTVTRPGLASIASSTAVELLVSVLQHSKAIHAPPPPLPGHEEPYEESVLGLVPHQMRGYLARFNTMLIVGAAFGNCTACSEIVITAYEKHGWDVLLRAFNEIGYLESLSGLDKLHAAGEEAMENVDWDEDDEGSM